jgi:cytochrome c oxidase assembly protein subunit 15
MTPFQRLCLVTCGVVFVLIVLGGIVRHSDSGLGCGDDWPRCEGSFIPRLEKDLLIEYGHRLTASIAGMLVFAILIVSIRSYRDVPAILYPAIAAFVLVLFQAGLGAAAVRNELDAQIVAVHLGMAMGILMLLAMITAAAIANQRPLPRPRVGRTFAQLALLALALTFPLMLIGSYVSGAGYGLACNGWPLCNGDVIPSAGAASVQVHFLHRVLAGVLGIVVLALAWLGWKSRAESPLAARLALVGLCLYAVQALLGAANIWTELAGEVSAAHLAFATLLWSALAVLNIRVHRLHELLPQSTNASRRSDLAGVTR